MKRGGVGGRGRKSDFIIFVIISNKHTDKAKHKSKWMYQKATIYNSQSPHQDAKRERN
jgi:hypothetical protein